MSHISTFALKVRVLNEDWLKRALGMLEDQFHGLRFKQENANLIMVRYSGIEQYQKGGNMRFVRNSQGEWVMQGDAFATRGEFERVKDAFTVAYQAIATSAYMSTFGYTNQAMTPLQNQQVVVVGRKW